MPDILANGIRIHYGQQGSGPPLVWAHGLFGTLHAWDDTAAFFRDRFRVIAYDARGHGCSEVPDRPDAYSQDIMVEDLRGVMDALGIERAIVGGHSMGGNVVLNFALKYPERCAGLIPVSTGSGSSDPDWWERIILHAADLAEQKGMAAVLDEAKGLEAWAPAFANPRAAGRIRQEVLNSSPKGIASTIRAVQTKRPTIFQLGPKLEALAVETLVVLGDLDTPVIECSHFMARQIPRTTLEVIPGAGHWVHLEEPQRFLQVLDRFLSRFAGQGVAGG